jgi:CarboxypepD_reg-like domain/Carboxypeptidase regulatory-like domain/Secretion system C-terminal sorting domain
MQQLQLSIPEPCHPNWHEMNPTQQGRFCNACAKEVIDFSTMSDSEVLGYFSSIKNEKVCGRAYPDQLDRAITMPKEIKKAKFWYWNYAAMFFLFFSKMSIKAQAQGQVITLPAKIDVNKSLQGRVGGIIINNKKSIVGKITDVEGNPVSFATIKIKGAKLAFAADANGNYSIKVNTKTDVLEVSAIGFETKEISCKDFSSTDIVLTQLENKWLGEVVVTVGAISYTENDYITQPNPKHVAVLEVKDNGTMQPVSNATVLIEKAGDNKVDNAVTDKKGIYKLRRIKEYETYKITIVAEGYLKQDIIIKETDFSERKKLRPVFLEKAPVLSDFKKLDGIVVQSTNCTIKKGYITGAATVVSGQMIPGFTIKNTLTDTVKLITTKIAGALKIYPNPVQRGNLFTLAQKLKQPGKYNIQIVDAAGRTVLQKQIFATSKEFIDKVQTDSRWSGGTYFVRVVDSNNRLISTNNLILQ